jgi:hypothetical protein
MGGSLEDLKALAKAHELLQPLLQLEEDLDDKDMELEEEKAKHTKLRLAVEEADKVSLCTISHRVALSA